MEFYRWFEKRGIFVVALVTLSLSFPAKAVEGVNCSKDKSTGVITCDDGTIVKAKAEEAQTKEIAGAVAAEEGGTPIPLKVLKQMDKTPMKNNNTEAASGNEK